jgi:hypothetical protein
MIKMTIRLIDWSHGRFSRSSVYAAVSAWFRANICVPVSEPVPVTTNSFSRLSRWLD